MISSEIEYRPLELQKAINELLDFFEGYYFIKFKFTLLFWMKDE
jgi:hypothetical protein